METRRRKLNAVVRQGADSQWSAAYPELGLEANGPTEAEARAELQRQLLTPKGKLALYRQAGPPFDDAALLPPTQKLGVSITAREESDGTWTARCEPLGFEASGSSEEESRRRLIDGLGEPEQAQALLDLASDPNHEA